MNPAETIDDVWHICGAETPTMYLPTVEQFNLWRAWVRWGLGCDDVGSWLGMCPLHDPGREGDLHDDPAWFNFERGTFSCSTPERCHPNKRGVTLVQLVIKIAERSLNG